MNYQISGSYFGPPKHRFPTEESGRKSTMFQKAKKEFEKTRLAYTMVRSTDNGDKMTKGGNVNRSCKDQRAKEHPQTFASDPVTYVREPTLREPLNSSLFRNECPTRQLEKHIPPRSLNGMPKNFKKEYRSLMPKEGSQFQAMHMLRKHKDGNSLNQCSNILGIKSKVRPAINQGRVLLGSENITKEYNCFRENTVSSIQKSMRDKVLIKDDGHHPLREISNGVSYRCSLTKEVNNKSPTRKRRRYIRNVDEEFDCGDKDTTIIEGGSTIDLKAVATMSPASESTKRQRYSCSQPIDEPIWSGIFKIGDNAYISVAAHLSTKSCEKVWKISRSLMPVVEVIKMSRSEVWPKSFETSSPTIDNIGVYFFPPNMSHKEGLDQLTKEVVEKDMALRVFVGEAEILIFSSALLPEQHQTFQKKHYLWGVFKRRADNVTKTPDQHNGTQHCEQAEETTNKQHMPLEKKRENRQPPVVTRGGDVEASQLSDQRRRPAERDCGEATNTVGEPHGKLFGFVVRQTPRIEKLIQEMEREGAVVVAVQGEMIMGASGIGQAVSSSRLPEQQRCRETIYF